MRCKECVVGHLGACAGDYCRTEREALIEWATGLAQEKGHHLGDFIKLKGESVWEARCLHCGGSLFISLSPEPGQPDVYGQATTQSCPSDDERPTGRRE